MQKRGFTRAQLKSCLVDKPSREKILAMTQEAWEGVKISGTPSFVVDGRLLPGTHDWKGLQPALPAPGKYTRCTDTMKFLEPVRPMKKLIGRSTMTLVPLALALALTACALGRASCG